MEHDLLQQRLGKLDGQLEALERDIKAASDAYSTAEVGSKQEAIRKLEYDRLVEEKKVLLLHRRELEAKLPGVHLQTCRRSFSLLKLHSFMYSVVSAPALKTATYGRIRISLSCACFLHSFTSVSKSASGACTCGKATDHELY